MSKLVPLSKFQSRYGLGQATSIADRANNALDGATLHIEAYLRTYFDAVVDDTTMYKIDSRQEPWREDAVVLYMPRGFVKADVEIRTAYTFPVLATAELINPTDYLVDTKKGLITLPPVLFESLSNYSGSTYDKMYMSLKYSGGLDKDSDGVYSNVPPWLQEAAMTAAKVLFSEDCGCTGDNTGCKRMLDSAIQGLLLRHMRFNPVARKPMI